MYVFVLHLCVINDDDDDDISPNMLQSILNCVCVIELCPEQSWKIERT